MSEKELKPVGMLVGDKWDKMHDISRRVYDEDGVCPTIPTGAGGNTEVKILQRPRGKNDGGIRDGDIAPTVTANTFQENVFVVGALRGRNPENPSDRTAGAPTVQMLEIRADQCTNTITSVQKDNVVIEGADGLYTRVSKAFDREVVTGLVRFSYVHIFEPSAMDDSSDEKYSVCIIIPKSDKKTIAAINAAVETAKEQGKTAKWKGKIPAKLKLPLRDGDEERPDDEAFENSFFFNCSSKTKPGIVDKNVQPILDAEEVYSGCYGRVAVNFYPFNTSGSNGVAAGLNNVQKLKDGEPLSGRSRAEDDFGDGFGDDFDDEDDPLA